MYESERSVWTLNEEDIFPPNVIAAWDKYLAKVKAASGKLYDRIVATRESEDRIRLLNAAWEDFVGEHDEDQGILDQKLKSLPA